MTTKTIGIIAHILTKKYPLKLYFDIIKNLYGLRIEPLKKGKIYQF